MSEPKWLLPEVVLAIHKILIADHGGAEGLRDAGLLDSALNRARQKHHYEKCDVAGLAACYAHALVTNHCFVDGNKRRTVNEQTKRVVMMFRFAAGEGDLIDPDVVHRLAAKAILAIARPDDPLIAQAQQVLAESEGK